MKLSSARTPTRLRRLGLGLSALLAACAADPKVIGSDCVGGGDGLCSAAAPLSEIENVDILLVLDNSTSLIVRGQQLQNELGKLVKAAVTGRSDGGSSFPRAASVHVAVTTPDLGVPGQDLPPQFGCTAPGDDGIFLNPGEYGLSCETQSTAYLSYDHASAAVMTAESLSCLPIVEDSGCGYEMPLEAALKSVWPESRTELTFLGEMSPRGHGEGENRGFLRDDSLLVVIIVTDEDDCSSRVTDHLGDFFTSASGGQTITAASGLPVASGEMVPATMAPEGMPPAGMAPAGMAPEGIEAPPLESPTPTSSLNPVPANLRCFAYQDELADDGGPYLQPVQRYVDAFKQLRPNNERFIFAVVAGIPPSLLTDADNIGSDEFYESILAAPEMQEAVDEGGQRLYPSCILQLEDLHSALPPRRLVRTAAAFGKRGVLGSLCAPDFGVTTGRLIHAIAEELDTATP